MILHRLFVPHVEHKLRAPALRYTSLIGYVLFILSIIFINHIVIFETPNISNILGYATNINVEDLAKYTNSLREEKGLNDLKLNTTLSKAAEAKAKDMFKDDYWAHTSPDGKEPWDFIIGSGYYYVYAGENLAVDFANSKNVVRAWYESPSHRENLLNDKYVDVGFAVVNGELQGRETTLVVQMFGAPQGGAKIASKLPGESASVEQIEVSEVRSVQKEVNIEQPAEIPKLEIIESSGNVLNASAVLNTSKFISIILGLFLSMMLSVDAYYVRRLGILRVSGHTIAHLALLVLVILGIWYTNIGLILGGVAVP